MDVYLFVINSTLNTGGQQCNLSNKTKLRELGECGHGMSNALHSSGYIWPGSANRIHTCLLDFSIPMTPLDA